MNEDNTVNMYYIFKQKYKQKNGRHNFVIHIVGNMLLREKMLYRAQCKILFFFHTKFQEEHKKLLIIQYELNILRCN